MTEPIDRYRPRVFVSLTDDDRSEFDEGAIAQSSRSFVILGEPGLGKSEALKQIGALTGVKPVRAAVLSHSASPEQYVSDGTILVDAIDELVSRSDGDALERVFVKLQEAGPSRFVLTCRSREWTAYSARGVDWANPEISQLEPLTIDDSLAILSDTFEIAEPREVTRHLDVFGLSELYKNPLTLRLIGAVAKVDASLPKSRGELFDRAVRLLWSEHDERREGSDLGRLNEEDALDAAGALMACHLLSGSEAITSMGAAHARQRDLQISDVEKLPRAEASRTIFGSKLFVSVEGGRGEPLHKVIAEFLASRWLARVAHTSRARSRLHASIAPGGVVPASLRGLHAWLVYHDRAFAELVIAADPYGLIRHGEVGTLDNKVGQQLLDRLQELEQSNPWFRAADWGGVSLGGLMRAELLEGIRKIIVSADSGLHLRSLVLESLEDSDLAGSLTPELEVVLLNRNLSYHERASALDAIMDIWSPIEQERWLSDLVEMGDETSTRLAREVADQHAATLEAGSIVRAILADLGLLVCSTEEEALDRSRILRWYSVLAERVDPSQILETVDGLVLHLDLMPEFHWSLKAALHEAIGTLVARAIEARAVDSSDAARIFQWLKALKSLDRSRDETMKLVRDAMVAAPRIRHAVQDWAFATQFSEFDYYRADMELCDLDIGLAQYGDADRLILALDLESRTQPETRNKFKALARIAYTVDGFSPEVGAFAEKFADGDQESSAFLRKLDSPPEPFWRRRQNRQRKSKDRASKIAIEHWRRTCAARTEEIRQGELEALYSPARALMGAFENLDHIDCPEERLRWALGDDVARSVLEGLEQFLRHSDKLNTVHLTGEFAQENCYRWWIIPLAAMAMRERRGQGYEDLSPDRRSALLMLWLDRNGVNDPDHLIEAASQRLRAEIFQEKGSRQAFIAEWLDASICADRANIPGLYAFAHDDEWREAAVPNAQRWLVDNERLRAETEAELTQILVSAEARDILADLGRARSDSVFPTFERLLSWLAVDVATRFEEVEGDLEGIALQRPEFIWFLRDAIQIERRGRISLSSTNAAFWIVNEFRTVWPYARLEGSSSGSNNDYDATDFISAVINFLASDFSAEAVEALERLAASPEDAYTAPIKLARDRQRQAQADSAHAAIGPDDLKALVSDGPPGSVTDLRSVVLDAIADAQARVRGDDIDSVSMFWTDEGGPRSETECSDRLAGMISSYLERYEILRLTEVDMPAGKRADLAFARDQMQLPLEAKGQWHKDVWDAASNQLDALYLKDWRSEGQGIYIVYWFGDLGTPRRGRVKAPPRGMNRPETPQQFAAMLKSRISEGRQTDISVVVFDLSR